MGLNPLEIKKDFPIFNRAIYGKPLVYLDSAATSQKPLPVIERINDYYRNYNANIHRGIYKIAEEATEAYQRSKDLTAKFINAESYRNIIYCRNTTEAINMVALTFGNANVKKGDHILITGMEHHSNIVPWQLLANKVGATLDYAMLKDGTCLDLEDYKKKLEAKPKIVALTQVSNVLGTINDVRELAKMGHEAGAVVLIDGAQSVPHMPVDVRDIDADFFAFSSHKMLGPAGLGVLYGKEDLLENTEPLYGGGDMIRSVDFQKSTWNELPWKFESGTPNIEGGIGHGAAIEYLNRIGMKNIRDHEKELATYALKKLEDVEGIEIYGYGKGREEKAGVISFNINGAHPHDVATIFDSEGICIRAGHHCAMPLVKSILGEPAVARMSFYIYNTEKDVDAAISAIDKVRDVLKLKK
jgi:cysteine desulfurase/selenocysteine lyase